MDWDIIIVISTIVFGLLFIILEMLVLPGGIVGIIGGLLMAYGVYVSFESFGTVWGVITLGATLLIVILGVYFAIRNKTWRKISLQEEISGKSGVNLDLDVEVGAVGRSVSRLSPMGKARFNDKLYEVSTHGEFIDEEQSIVISLIKDQRIYVKLNQ